MSTSLFRQLTTVDVPEFAELTHKAYPRFGFNAESMKHTTEWVTNAIDVYPSNDLWGLFQDGTMVAGMGTLRMETNVRGAIIPTWGANNVATDMLHKRQGLATELIGHYLTEARRQGFTLAALYPFRTDFYKKMGFGHAALMHQYRIKPAAFPGGGDVAHLVNVTRSEADRAALLACHTRFLRKTHGAVARVDTTMGDLINSAHRAVAYRPGSEVLGFIVYRFDLKNEVMYDLQVEEFIWEVPEALHALLTFLRNQQDQVGRVVINTPEDHLHMLVSEPSSGRCDGLAPQFLEMRVTGVGAMFRVIDLPALIGQLAGQRIGFGTCTVQVNLRDDFLSANHGPVLLQVEDGVVVPAGDRQPEVELTIGVGEFSSLLLGGTDLFTLHRYALAHLSDDQYLPRLAGVFAAPYRPIFSFHF